MKKFSKYLGLTYFFMENQQELPKQLIENTANKAEICLDKEKLITACWIRPLLHIVTSLLILLVSASFKSNEAQAQQTHRYTLVSNQPPVLVADAGEDIFSPPDETVTLGGDPTASGGTTPYSYFWQPAENLSDPELSHPEVTVGQSDITYTLTVTDAAGCTAVDEATIFVDIPTSVTENREIPFAVYPNPAHSGLVIQTGKAGGGTLTLFDYQGKQVLKESITPLEHHLDTRLLSSGVYLLTLQMRQEYHTFQIVVP